MGIPFTFIIIVLLFNRAVAQDSSETLVATSKKSETFLNDDTIHNWTSIDFPKAYPPVTQILIVKCDPGYSVTISIDILDIDGASGDFLVIKPGASLEEKAEAKLFTYKVENKEPYLIQSNTVFLSLQVAGNNNAGKQGFSLTYRRIGEPEAILPEQPGTPPPDPSENEAINLTVFVAGKTETEFKTGKVQEEFKKCVSQMAIEYCKINNFTLSSEITTENVKLDYITQCPFTWPAREICMKVRFAVPIYLAKDSPLQEYQLTAVHLERMWYSLGNKYLAEYEMAIYTEPSNRSTFKWWIIILCGTIVSFSILLYLLKVFRVHIPNYPKDKKKIEANALPGYLNGNNLTLNPYPYSQSIPPMWGYEEHNGYEPCESNYNVTNPGVPMERDSPAISDSDEEIYPNSTNTNTNTTTV